MELLFDLNGAERKLDGTACPTLCRRPGTVVYRPGSTVRHNVADAGAAKR
jgi:hypothetical protein